MAETFSKILILRFSSLGDIIMTTAAVRCLRKRFPNAQIDMAVRSDFLPLVEHNPHLNRIWSVDRKGGAASLRKLVRDLNVEKYDAVYDAHGSLRSRLMLPWIHARSKKRFNKHYIRRSLALTFKLPLLDDRRFLEKFIDPIQSWGVQYDGLGPEIALDPKSLERVEIALTAYPKGSRVGLIPSAQWPGKRWAPEKFRELLGRLIDKTDHSFLIFGGPEDTFCQQIAEDFPTQRVLQLQGKLNLPDAIAAVSTCEYVIANDTGLMHVADALGVPSVLIFGPTSAALGCLPYTPQSVLVEKQLWCRPCSKNGQAPCIRGKRVCLEDITPEDVFKASQHLERRLFTSPPKPLSWGIDLPFPTLEPFPV